ncbi:unnamed protein product [Didymodactylos carnosus]|uniref:Metalloendopeptidase n=1 Tax=Didymodactylos carnosus TaxID=1234261 RepID=A0A815ALF6_9BILA|nr:unnamed protein product [Didymodactylos carnosus]CAF1261184.1 unnamed protein product [Didymodactylos carnosus]CAF3859858.1 unnamed protein product [Didymodactylos carnosus]CAF4038958.1 unnamed protein product [Didymodactylos carnosus]
MYWYSTITLLLYVATTIHANALERFGDVSLPLMPDVHAPHQQNVQSLIHNEHVKLVEGDIAVPSDQAHLRNLVLSSRKWSNRVVPFVFDPASGYTAAQQNTITAAMAKMTEQTNNCIRFVRRSNEPTWLRITASTGCWSYLGQIYTSGAQDLSLRKDSNYNCVSQGTVIHELMHALGYDHEHNRPDRDNYIQIEWNNVQSDLFYAFDRQPASAVNTFNHGYDYGSIMHYRQDAFSKNGKPTMVPTYPGWQSWVAQMGNGNLLSANDIDKIKKHYGCA